MDCKSELSAKNLEWRKDWECEYLRMNSGSIPDLSEVMSALNSWNFRSDSKSKESVLFFAFWSSAIRSLHMLFQEEKQYSIQKELCSSLLMSSCIDRLGISRKILTARQWVQTFRCCEGFRIDVVLLVFSVLWLYTALSLVAFTWPLFATFAFSSSRWTLSGVDWHDDKCSEEFVRSTTLFLTSTALSSDVMDRSLCEGALVTGTKSARFLLACHAICRGYPAGVLTAVSSKIPSDKLRAAADLQIWTLHSRRHSVHEEDRWVQIHWLQCKQPRAPTESQACSWEVSKRA